MPALRLHTHTTNLTPTHSQAVSASFIIYSVLQHKVKLKLDLFNPEKRSKQPISKVSLTISEIIHSEAVRRMCQLTSFIHYFKFTLIRTERVRTNPIMHQKARQGNTHRANTLHANIFTVSSPPPPV